MRRVTLRRRLRLLRGRHGAGIAAVLLGTLLNAAVLTDGTVDLTRAESTFGTYYDALGESLLRGRFDVPPRAIGPEAFLIDGRTYGYFGPTPALLRIPLNALFPSMRGHWTRLMMLAACALTLLPTYLIVHQLLRAAGPAARRRPLPGMEAAFVMCAALGTPLFFIMRSPVVYHEAGAFGVMFAMWAYVGILRSREGGGAASMAATVAALLCAILSFQARGSVGAGPMLALLLLLTTMHLGVRTRGAPARHALVVALIAGISTSAVLYKNVRVFGNLWGAPPLSRHVQVMGNPERLALTGGGSFVQPFNLRTTLYNYLNPASFILGSPFPFFHAVEADDLRVFPETRLDHREPFASLTGINPLWCVLAAVGLAAVARPRIAGSSHLARLRIVIAGALAGAVPILIAACITQRYLYDTYPVLVIAGAAGLRAAVAWRGRAGWARASAPALVLLALYTCCANVALAISLPRWE